MTPNLFPSCIPEKIRVESIMLLHISYLETSIEKWTGKKFVQPAKFAPIAFEAQIKTGLMPLPSFFCYFHLPCILHHCKKFAMSALSVVHLCYLLGKEILLHTPSTPCFIVNMNDQKDKPFLLMHSRHAKNLYNPKIKSGRFLR